MTVSMTIKIVLHSAEIVQLYLGYGDHLVSKNIKYFFLLLLPNKLSTRGLLKRKNMKLDSYTCELYFLQKEEKLKHLFLRYHFTKNCWLQIGVIVPSWLRPKRAGKHIKTALQVPFCNGSHHTHVLEYLDRK
jgi:hypothetical protein